jgi:hypothetical protein
VSLAIDKGLDATHVAAWVLAAGGVFFSVVMIVRTLRAHRRHHQSGVPFPGLLRMTVRRVALGALLATVCVMLVLGVAFIEPKTYPRLVGVYWTVVLLLLVWLLVLAVIDLLHAARRLHKFLDWEKEQRKKEGK